MSGPGDLNGRSDLIMFVSSSTVISGDSHWRLAKKLNAYTPVLTALSLSCLYWAVILCDDSKIDARQLALSVSSTVRRLLILILSRLVPHLPRYCFDNFQSFLSPLVMFFSRSFQYFFDSVLMAAFICF